MVCVSNMGRRIVSHSHPKTCKIIQRKQIITPEISFCRSKCEHYVLNIMYIAYLKTYLSNFEDFELFPFADRVTDADCTVLRNLL